MTANIYLKGGQTVSVEITWDEFNHILKKIGLYNVKFRLDNKFAALYSEISMIKALETRPSEHP